MPERPPAVDEPETSSAIALGISLGMPSILNLHLEYWGDASFPVVLRLAGLRLGEAARGIELAVGWAFDIDGVMNQAIDISYIGSRLENSDYEDEFASSFDGEPRYESMRGVALSYGLNLSGFHLRSGFAVAGESTYSFPQLTFQIGYVRQFDLSS